MPKNTYPGVTRDVAVVGVANALVVEDTMSEPLAYALTKVLFDKQQDLAAIHPEAAKLRLDTAVTEIVRRNGAVVGVVADGRFIAARRAVILACGGFEGAPELQRQFWSIKPVLSAAVRSNTGDGLRMAQLLGADLWHLWHFHGSYGFRHPDPAYPFGIRLKRLPDWIPGRGLRDDVRMSWILLDRAGRRFTNEYDPYMQDTGHRSVEPFDPVTQTYPRIPALLLVDAKGRALYPLSAPTWHDGDVAARFGTSTPRGLDDLIL